MLDVSGQDYLVAGIRAKAGGAAPQERQGGVSCSGWRPLWEIGMLAGNHVFASDHRMHLFPAAGVCTYG